MRTFQSTILSGDTEVRPTDLVNYYCDLSQNNSQKNINLAKSMIVDAHRYLLQKYYFNETSFSIQTVSGQQGYKFPYNYSTLKDLTITVGQLRWVPEVILTREQWDQVNFLPYTSDIPQYIFIYNGEVQIFPIPSTTGNTITFNYKFRVPDLSLADYSTGTAAVTNGSTTVTGTGTSWLTPFLQTAGSVFARNIWMQFKYPNGDGNWYQVLSIESGTSLTLAAAYQGPTATAINFVMGQTPAILEDFQDLLVYRPLTIYFSTIQKDPVKLEEFQGLYDKGIEAMDNYVGEKVLDVDLGLNPQPTNPNLFIYKN
jgi:hypothetical protein